MIEPDKVEYREMTREQTDRYDRLNYWIRLIDKCGPVATTVHAFWCVMLPAAYIGNDMLELFVIVIPVATLLVVFMSLTQTKLKEELQKLFDEIIRG